MGKFWPKQVSDFPIGEDVLFVILTPRSIHIPGDERSRTNPGHGYPAHTESCWDIELYSDEESWKSDIVNLTRRRVDFKAVRMFPVKVVTEVNVV